MLKQDIIAQHYCQSCLRDQALCLHKEGIPWIHQPKHRKDEEKEKLLLERSFEDCSLIPYYLGNNFLLTGKKLMGCIGSPFQLKAATSNLAWFHT